VTWSQLATAPVARTMRAPGTGDGLAPVRDALLAAADAEAGQVLATAEAAAREMRDAADRQAVAIGAQARADGEAAAEQVLVTERARDRREAHHLALQARRRAWEELRRQAHAAVEALATEPGYPELTARLADIARAKLGDADQIIVDGPDGPGVVARAGRRRVDLRLTVLADRALARLGPRVEELWR